MKNKSIVLDLGFGDAGKGHFTNYLCSNLKGSDVGTIFNIRFSGGPQAGHTVYWKDRDRDISHIFSSFGAGTFNPNVLTYILPTAIVDPICIINELDVLKTKGIDPKDVLFVIHPDTPVITPYEVYDNRACSQTLSRGSCGKGIRATYKREEVSKHHILARDFLFPRILETKLQSLKEHYYKDIPLLNLDLFFECVKKVTDFAGIEEIDLLGKICVYEGSQGLLLDKHKGFYPNTTPSSTGIQNLNLEDHGLYYTFKDDPDHVDVYLVTRAYQTRHGNGFMTNLELEHNIKDNQYESNELNKYQGEFRKSILDLDLLRYAISVHHINPKLCNLVITHMDLVKNEWCFTYHGSLNRCSSEDEFVHKIQKFLGIINLYDTRNVFLSKGPYKENIKRF